MYIYVCVYVKGGVVSVTCKIKGSGLGDTAPAGAVHQLVPPGIDTTPPYTCIFTYKYTHSFIMSISRRLDGEGVGPPALAPPRAVEAAMLAFLLACWTGRRPAL